MPDFLKSVFLGIVEGITEWLPISSTGHLILTDEFIKLDMSDKFMEMFNVVIQLGAILAVVVIFWSKLWPFTADRKKGYSYISKGTGIFKKNIMDMWFKVIVAAVPAAVIGLPLDDWMDDHFYNPWVVAATLIIYGVLFIIIEKRNKTRVPSIKNMNELTYKTALLIGAFQVLSLIPGTSRSGTTILGAILLGVSRVTAAEFSFYLAIPVMFGASLVKFGFDFSGKEVGILITGMVTAFVISVIAIRFLMGYIRKKDFTAFGWYRIALGIVVIGYFLIVK